MNTREKKLARLERLKKQCPPKVYPKSPKPKEEELFVPSRSLMYERMKQETLKTKSVKEDLSAMPRKERRRTMRSIVRSAIDDIRTKMINARAKMNQ